MSNPDTVMPMLDSKLVLLINSCNKMHLTCPCDLCRQINLHYLTMQCTRNIIIGQGTLVSNIYKVGNGTELEAVGFLFEPYLWRPCGVTWDSS